MKQLSAKNMTQRATLYLLALSIVPALTTYCYFKAVPPYNGLIFICAKILIILLPLCFSSGTQNNLLHRGPTQLNQGWGHNFLFALIASLAIVLGYLFILKNNPHWSLIGENIYLKLSTFGLKSAHQFLLLAATMCLFNSFLEEYFWRWFLFDEWKKFVGATKSYFIGALLFTIHHVVVLNIYLPKEVIFSFVFMIIIMAIFLGGFFWNWSYDKHRNFFAIWTSHIIVDISIMLIGYTIISKKN